MGVSVMDQVDRLRAALADRYELGEEIGRGGMACVYRAHDRLHDRDVAIKVLRPEMVAALGTERFLREIRIEARLQHPHILALFDSGTADGFLYYVMPYVEGETLRDRLRREKQLPLPAALAITRQVADALSYAHAHDVVHRDIKPANILLTGEHAVVADFGIATAVSAQDEEALTGTGVAVGTPEYMSPEQGSGEDDVDQRSDVYSLGCVVYEMLAGQPPFTGRTAQSVLARHRSETPPSLRVVRPALPRAVEQVIETALAKVPADRFATADELFRSLAASAARPMEEPANRRRRGRLAVAGALLLSGLLGLWWTAASRDGPADPNKVVVFPLVAHGREEGGGATGEAVGIAIGSAFEHTEPLKWIDGWSWLAPDQRNDARTVSAEVMRRISRDQHARYFVEGSVLWSGDSASVVLRLHDGPGDSVVARVHEVGAAAPVALPQTGLRAAVGLLPALVQPGHAVDPVLPSALLEREPAAVAHWLQGEREYRRSRYEEALLHFRRAVEADSGLALAAVRGAAAANWLEWNEEAAGLTAAALSRADALPAKYAALAHGLKQYLAGAADSSILYFRRALAADSTWNLAWMGLADVYFHLLPTGAQGDSAAGFALAQALREDPTFAPALFHSAQLALWRKDLSRAREMADAFDRQRPDSAPATQLSLMLRCAGAPGSRGTPWIESAARAPMDALLAAKTLSGAAAYPACAAEGFRAVLAAASATPGERWGAVVGLQTVLVAQGQYAAAQAVLDTAIGSGLQEAMGLIVVDAAAGAPMQERARAVVASLAGDYGAMSPRRLWYHGLWASREGDGARTATIAQALAAKAEASGDPRDRLRAESMAARASVLSGDTLGAIALLRGLAPRAPAIDLTWGEWESLAGERLLLARLLLARGEAREALRVAATHDHPQPIENLLYLPASLVVRREAASRLGLDRLAAEYRERLEALGRQDLVGTLK